MNDWLSKIEKRLKGLSKYRASWRGNAEGARMARVIRELTEHLKDERFHDVKCGWEPIFEEQENGDIWLTGYRRIGGKCNCNAYYNFSPDAKELLKCSDG